MDNFWKLEDYQKDWLMENQIAKRLKSFAWRFCVYMVTIGLAWLTDNIGLLELSPFLTATVALLLGEATKMWNNKMRLQGKTFLGRMIRPKEDDRV